MCGHGYAWPDSLSPDYDPPLGTDTRQLAFERLVARAGLLRNKCLQALKDAALTVHEIAERIGETVPSTQPRISELAKAGKVAKTTLRRPNASGRSAAVWVLT